MEKAPEINVPFIPEIKAPSVNDLKPNLVDPSFKLKLDDKFKAQGGVWDSTKSSITNFYNNYIKPNIWIIILVIVIIAILIYRYRVTKNRKEEEQINAQTEDTSKTKTEKVEQYANLIMELRKRNMEESTEPLPETPKYPHNIIYPRRESSRFAYPVYPYHSSPESKKHKKLK